MPIVETEDFPPSVWIDPHALKMIGQKGKRKMKILRTNIENLESDKKALYKLTKTPGVNVKDIEPDKSHGVAAYALYSDEKRAKDGTVSDQTVLAIILESGEKLQTISQTFIDAFNEIADLMDGESFAIITRKSTSKGGREFVTCELDCD